MLIIICKFGFECLFHRDLYDLLLDLKIWREIKAMCPNGCNGFTYWSKAEDLIYVSIQRGLNSERGREDGSNLKLTLRKINNLECAETKNSWAEGIERAPERRTGRLLMDLPIIVSIQKFRNRYITEFQRICFITKGQYCLQNYNIELVIILFQN